MNPIPLRLGPEFGLALLEAATVALLAVGCGGSGGAGGDSPESAEMFVTPTGGWWSSGAPGGPFLPEGQDYKVTNTGSGSLTWSVRGPGMLTTVSGGTLSAGESATVNVSLDPSLVDLLSPGVYLSPLRFVNETNHLGDLNLEVELTVNEPGDLTVTPATGFVVQGPQGGPFTPTIQPYTLKNTGGSDLTWSVATSHAWLSASVPGGTLTSGQQTSVDVSLDPAALAAFGPGLYPGSVTFTNESSAGGEVVLIVQVDVLQPGTLIVTPDGDFQPSGPPGGPFAPTTMNYTLQNVGDFALNWTAALSITWAQLSSAGGTLSSGQQVVLSASLTSEADPLLTGFYPGEIEFTDAGLGAVITTEAIGLNITSGVGVPYFEKGNGSLNYMGVSVTRTSTAQQVWAPGAPTQEYPGGWVTPGTYDIALNIPRIHHEKDGTLSGQLRPTHKLLGTVINKALTDPGWVSHGFFEPPEITPQEWGSAQTITLSAGDVLHVAYGNSIVEWQKRNGSDGIVVYCVDDVPDYRGGLWGTGASGWSQASWDLLKTRIIEAAPMFVVKTSGFYYGPSTIQSPLPSDYQNVSGDGDNRQTERVGRFMLHRAFEKLQQGASWTGSDADLQALFEFFCNNAQHCFLWSDYSGEHYHYAHGWSRYPPYQIEAMLSAIVAAVALGYDPDYEPLYRMLTNMAQRVDMTLSHGGSYTYSNTISSGGLASHKDDTPYTKWLWYTLGHTDMGAKGSHRHNVWGPCLWARDLMGWPSTPATSDMLTKSGKGPLGDQDGHEWSSTGAGAGYDTFYNGLEVKGAMWLWFTDTNNTSQFSRWSRRNYMYKHDPGDPGTPQHPEYWGRWVQDTFVDEPQGLAGGFSGGQVSLDWLDNQDSDLSHYRVYRGLSSTQLTLLADDVLTSDHVDTGGLSDTTYHYAVTAIDTDGNEGSLSDQASVTVP